MKGSDIATMAPARTASPRVVILRGAEVNASTPPPANGMASKKPASAREGKGTSSPPMTSFQDQTSSPAPQLNAELANRTHPTRLRPALRAAPNPQLPAA